MSQVKPTSIPTLREGLALLVRLAVLVRPYWLGVMLSFMLGLVVSLTGLAVPYLSKLFYDRVFPARDVGLMHVLVLSVGTISIVSSVLGSIRGYFAQTLSVRLSAATSLMFFNHLNHLPVPFFETHRVGEITSRFADVRSSLNALTGGFQTLLGSGIYILFVPPFLVLISWKLAIISLFTVPITAALSAVTSRFTRKYWKVSAEASAELSAQQIEALTHIRTMKMFAAEHQVFSRLQTQMLISIKAQLSASAIGTLVGFTNAVVRAVGAGMFSWFAWTLIIEGEISLGDFVAFNAYVGFLLGPISQLANLFANFQQSVVNLGRMFEYLDLATEQNAAESYYPSKPFPRARGQITFKAVSFGYTAERQVLSNVSLDLRPGSVTAVVGPSGAGKSSLLRLVCRLDDPQSGTIEIDGEDISTIPIRQLRSQIAVVWQDVALIRGTFWENLTLGITDQSRDLERRVSEAVGICQLDPLISSLPERFATPIAEWGATLSGGQRQRIAVARALIREAPILLLDEATSQIDVESERALLVDLLSRYRGRTVVMVTHRVLTAPIADQVCMLRSGAVVGLGHHHELSSTCQEYSELVDAAGIGVVASFADRR